MEAILTKLVTALGELRLGLTAEAETTLEDAIAFFLGTHDEVSETLRLELLTTIVESQRKEDAWRL